MGKGQRGSGLGINCVRVKDKGLRVKGQRGYGSGIRGMGRGKGLTGRGKRLGSPTTSGVKE